jgi:hypothetical protein
VPLLSSKSGQLWILQIWILGSLQHSKKVRAKDFGFLLRSGWVVCGAISKPLSPQSMKDVNWTNFLSCLQQSL